MGWLLAVHMNRARYPDFGKNSPQRWKFESTKGNLNLYCKKRRARQEMRENRIHKRSDETQFENKRCNKAKKHKENQQIAKKQNRDSKIQRVIKQKKAISAQFWLNKPEFLNSLRTKKSNIIVDLEMLLCLRRNWVSSLFHFRNFIAAEGARGRCRFIFCEEKQKIKW